MKWFYISSTGILAACVTAAVTKTPSSNPHAWIFICVAVITFYLLAVIALRAVPDKAVHVFYIMAAAVMMRLCMWFVTPEFTTDYYRYVWDGKVYSHGVNPYLHEPRNPALKHLRSPEIYPKINFKDVPTSYGPAAEYAFKYLYCLFGENISHWRAVFIVFDILNALLIVLILSTLGLPRKWAAIYAFNPLILIELCANMHLDVMLVTALLCACLAILRKRFHAAIVFLAVATMVKYFAILMLPAFMALGWGIGAGCRYRKCMTGLLAFVTAILLGYLPFVYHGVDVFRGVIFFSNDLASTAWSPHFMIAGVLGRTGANILAATLLCLLAASGVFASDVRKWALVLFVIVAAVALLSPVQRPWYFVWGIPLCCIRISWSWLVLSCMALLTYAAAYTEFDYFQIKFVIYMSFYVSVIFELFLRRGAGISRREFIA
jgi:hypothetical protein